MTWWQWIVSTYVLTGVFILFAFLVAGAFRVVPWYRVMASAFMWPYVVVIAILDESR